MTFWERILGSSDHGLLAASFIYAIIGHCIVLLLGTTLRDPSSLNSPKDFSLKYLIYDNFKRIATVVLLIVVSLRFSPDLLGRQLNEFTGFLVGIGLDGVALLLKQKTKIFDPVPKQ